MGYRPTSAAQSTSSNEEATSAPKVSYGNDLFQPEVPLRTGSGYNWDNLEFHQQRI